MTKRKTETFYAVPKKFKPRGEVRPCFVCGAVPTEDGYNHDPDAHAQFGR